MVVLFVSINVHASPAYLLFLYQLIADICFLLSYFCLTNYSTIVTRNLMLRSSLQYLKCSYYWHAGFHTVMCHALNYLRYKCVFLLLGVPYINVGLPVIQGEEIGILLACANYRLRYTPIKLCNEKIRFTSLFKLIEQ